MLPVSTSPPATGRGRSGSVQTVAVVVFVAIAVVGTYLVKWHPYVLKGLAASGDHSLGASIVSGHSAAAPQGWQAALDYGYHYGLSTWQALVVGLLVAAGVQELLPRDWLLRFLGRAGGRCSAPPAVSLARERATVGATMAYWLGNPVLNPATIVFVGLVLG